jgi:RHS repeat-associated protein
MNPTIGIGGIADPVSLVVGAALITVLTTLLSRRTRLGSLRTLRWVLTTGLAVALLAIGVNAFEASKSTIEPAGSEPTTPGGLPANTSATGSFEDSFPIQVPGFHGVEPRVSLDYDSAAGNGEVGVGWHLRAGSEIVRGGAHGGLPLYDNSDAFLVDGMELVACAPNCQTGGTHETRQQSFERFVFDGTTWTRWRRDGVKLVYEVPNEEPTSAYRWLLARVVDTHGNTVTYGHDCAGHCFVDRITYAAALSACGEPGQPTCKAGAEIRFYYEPRHDIVTYATGKSTVQIRQRLRTVAVRMDGHLVTAYALRYATNPSTGNSLLRSIQQFPSDADVAADGTVTAGPTLPPPPTTFTTASMSAPQPQWTTGATSGVPITSVSGQPNFSAVTTSIRGTGGRLGIDGYITPRSPLYGDFDGDGRVDVASGTSSNCFVRLGIDPHEGVKTTSGKCDGNAYVIDLNGDGADDLLLPGLRQAVSKRDGTFAIKAKPTATPWGNAPFKQCATADLNGDDLGDLACVYQSSSMPPRLGTMRSTPDGGWVPADLPLPDAVTSIVGVGLVAAGDVDASTTSDIVLAVAQPNTDWRLFIGSASSDGTIASWVSTPTTWNRGDSPLEAWRLSSADIDGDARADTLLIAGDTVLPAMSEKGRHSLRVPNEPIMTGAENLAMGDADGDGRDDILTGAPAGWLRAKGDGTFERHQPFTSAADEPAKPCDPEEDFEPVAAAADQNGDGQADLLCATFRPHHPHFDLGVQPSPVAPPADHRWTPFDHNGDGRQDLYTVHYRNPGYEIHTRLGQAEGDYLAATPLPVLPETGGPPLNNPDASAWIAADVGGGLNGAPDGKTDLTMLEGRPGAALQVTTLLSTGSGWDRKCTSTPCITGTAIPDGTDLRTWRLAQINGDDRADLVHFQPLGAGVRVEYLLSNGDGTWTARGADASGNRFQSAAPQGGPLTRTDVASFRISDLNLDGLSDFTHVEVGGGASSSYITIRSLISTGPATWREETWRRFQPIDTAAAHQLQFMDIDGDRVPDLGRAAIDAGCVLVEAYTQGLDGWSPADTGSAPAPCQAPNGLEDRHNLVLADVNNDGRTDVYHLSRVGHGPSATNAIFTMLNPGDPANTSRWTIPQQPALATSIPESWALIGLDTDHDGTAELAHTGWPVVTTLRWNAGDDRLTDIDNGRGARTSITYHAQAAARSYLPAGTLPIVVDRITVSDSIHNSPVQATTAFTYHDARWSTRHRKLIGYGTIDAKQGQTVVVTDNELTDACGASPSSTSLNAASGRAIARTTTHFKAPGAQAPFTCLPEEVHQEACELTTHCLQRQTIYDYDEYGNVKTMEESGEGGLRRRTNTPVRPNTTNYIVDRPYAKELQVPDPSAPGSDRWVTTAKTLFGYDDDTWEHAPHDHGDLSRVTSFSDLATDKASETFHQYDDVGNLIRTDDPGGWTTTTYDGQRSLFPVSNCNPIGCTNTIWDETLGIIRSVTDQNHQTTTTDHDAFGRPTTTTRPDHSTTTISYLATGVVTGPDSERQRIRTEVSDGSPRDGVHWHEDLIDGLGRVYRSLDEGVTASPDDVIVTDTRYGDASSRRAAISLPHTRSQPPRWTSYGYDPAGRLTATLHPGTGTGQTSRTFHVGTVEERDELGHVTTSHHDAFGRIVQVDEHVRPCPDCDPEVQATHYTYDPSDRLLTITDALDNVTTIVRDALGQALTVTDPDRGTRTLIWRADGNLDEEHDANGVHTWTYDAAGRRTSRTDRGPTGTQTATWDYDRDPVTKQTQGASIGHITRVTYTTVGSLVATQGSDRFWYDNLGRAVLARYCVEQTCHDMGYTYDEAGRVKDMRYPKPDDPGGEHVAYTYDSAGNLTSVGDYLTQIQHDAAGQTTQQTYGNGLVEQFTYDPDRLWVDTQTLAKTPRAVQPLYSATYTHDPTARITALTTTNPTGPAPRPVTEHFTYDELGRLATHSSSDHPSPRPQTYEYDAIGRLTNSPTAGNYHYNDAAHIHASTSTSAGHQRSYDAGGNLKSLTDTDGRSLKLTWTPQGMPQTIANGRGLTTMAYGADGQRVKRESVAEDDATTYFFSRYTQQGAAGLTKYYWAGDQLIAVRNPNGTMSYVMQDHVHSTRVITDQHQNVTGRYNYEPYGKQKTGNPTHDTTQRWQGKRYEPDSGLDYMNARFYDSELGQFTAADSIVPNPYQPQTLNRYAFTNGDGGINAEDPSGHMSMRVEQKKERDQESRSAYARAYNLSCQSESLPCNSYTNAGGLVVPLSEYEQDWLHGKYDPPTAPPLLAADEPCCSDPAEWIQWPGALTPPPLVTGDDAPLSAPPLIRARSRSARTDPSAPPLIAADTWIDPSTGKEFVVVHHTIAAGGDAAKWANLAHWFIETPTNTFGMGAAGGTATGPLPPGWWRSLPVAILPQDELPRGGEGYYATRVYGPPGFTQKVDQFARSESLGTYIADGTCQTFCADVLRKAGAESVDKTFAPQTVKDVGRSVRYLSWVRAITGW